MITKDNYYQDRTYITNSLLGVLLDDPATFQMIMSGEYKLPKTKDMIIGNVAHGKLFERLSGGTYIDDFEYVVVDDYRLNSKKGKEYYESVVKPYEEAGKNVIMKSDYDMASEMVDKMFLDPAMFDYFTALSEEYILDFEVIHTGEYMGVPIKCKVDIECKDMYGVVHKIIDYKTTRSLGGFRHSVYLYGYNRQAAMYTTLTGLNLYDNVFDFIAQEKGTGNVRVFETDRIEFAQSCYDALNDAIARYIHWENDEILDVKKFKL